jgi:polyisoprenoid-binding protein YceI
MTRTLFAALVVLTTGSLADLRIAKVSELQFNATGPAGLKITGQTSKLEVSEAGDDLTLRVPLDTVDTGISLRNAHMKEKYLETGKFPFAELKVPRAALKEGAGQKATAAFTVHGQTRDVTVAYDVSKTADGLEVKASFDLNINAHGITVPSYLGVTVKPDMKVVTTFVVAP